MKYPTVYPFLEKEYQESKPIYPVVEEPKKPYNLWMSFVIGAFLVWFIADLVWDIVNNAGIFSIGIDILCIMLYIGLEIMVLGLYKSYRRAKKIWEEYDKLAHVSDANPLVELKKLLAYYSRGKYIRAQNISDAEYLKMHNKAPKKFAKLMETLPEDTETCNKLLRIAVKDPSVLKEFTKFDKAEERISNAIFEKYRELMDKTPEELEKIEKDYDKLDGMRKFSREWNKNKKKK